MQRSKFTIFPESAFKTYWDMIGFAFIVIQSIMIPFNLCFSVNPTGFMGFLEYLIDCFFIVDMIINFNCGFYKKGVLIMTRKEIMINYLKTWFVLDALATFPYTWVINFEEI
jgi:hypothetical protein